MYRFILSLVLLLFGMNSQAQLSNGLVGEFLFNGSLTDSSPMGINGSGIGMTNTAQGHDGIAGGSYTFNGPSTYVDLGSSNRSITTEVTVAVYYKTTSTAYCILVSDYLYGDDKGFILCANTEVGNVPGKVYIAGRAGDGNYRISGPSTTSINDGQWHCIVGVVSTNSWAIYVDGVLESSNTYTSNNLDISSPSRNTFIGHINSTTPQYTYGEIDDVRIWNRALSANEVANMCSCTIPITFGQSQYNFCGNGNVTVTANNVDSLYWPATGTNGTSLAITPPFSGYVAVEAYRSGSCTGIDSVMVNASEKPTGFELGPNITECAASSPITIGNTNYTADSYLWSDGTTTPLNTIQYPQAGWQILRITANNCTFWDSVFVTWVEIPTINLGLDQDICPDEPLLLTANYTGTGNIAWSNGGSGPTTTVTEAGTYYATITNNCGSSTDTIVIDDGLNCDGSGSNTNQPFIPSYYLPNAFSPNGDGLNDLFGIHTEISFSAFKMTIYDRWSNVIYRSTDYSQSWNGLVMNTGEEVPEGVYVYDIVFTLTETNETHTVSGLITVVK